MSFEPVVLCYPLLLLLLFAGAKVMKKGEWNEEVMSFRHTKAFLGFASIVIIFHHASQRVCAPWLSPGRIHHGMDAFVYVGYLCVASFFFCSGYGMYTAFLQKEGFFEHYFRRRILPIVFPALVMWLVFFSVEKLRGIRVDPPILINAYSYIWYIPAILYLYAVFYFCFHIVKSSRAGMVLLWAGTILYIVAALLFSPGTWWFNTVHLFPVGAMLAKNRESVLQRYRKGYALYVTVFSMITVVCFTAASYYPQLVFALGGKYNETVHFLLEGPGQMISAYTFAVLMMLIGMKVRIGNRVLYFLGAFTLETYLVHPLFVQLFSYAFVFDYAAPVFYIRNQLLYVISVLIPSIPLAFLLHWADMRLAGRKSPSGAGK